MKSKPQVVEPRRRRYGSRRCRCSPQDCADGCSSKRVNEGLCVAGFRCRWCGGENSSREQHLVKDAYTLSLTYVGVVAHVRGRTAALVCRIPSLLPNGAGCSVVATSVFACPDYWGCGATFTLSCVVGGLAGRSQEDCVISHMTDIRRGVCGRYRIRKNDTSSSSFDRSFWRAAAGRFGARWLWRSRAAVRRGDQVPRHVRHGKPFTPPPCNPPDNCPQSPAPCRCVSIHFLSLVHFQERPSGFHGAT